MEVDMEQSNLFNQSSIHTIFISLPDPRKKRNLVHPMINIITIAICAILCGANDWVAVEVFGHAKYSFFSTFLNLEKGIPSHDTFNKFFRFLDPDQFETNFINWTKTIACSTKGKIIPIDGKVLRHSTARDSDRALFDLVSAYHAENEIVLGQLAVEDLCTGQFYTILLHN